MPDHHPEASLGRWVHVIDRCAHRFANQRLRDRGIGKGQLFILASLIYDGDNLTQENLAQRFHLERGATARTLASLESKGYVRRTTDPKDARAKRVRVTGKAKRLWPMILRESNEWNRILTEGFRVDERRKAIELVTRMARNAMAHLARDTATANKRGARKAVHGLILFLGITIGLAAGMSRAQDVAPIGDTRVGSETGVASPERSGEALWMDVATVLRLAGENSLDAAVARDDSVAAQAAIDEAQAAWWPTITVNGSYTIKDNPVVAVFGDARFPFAEKNSAAYGINAKQLLFSGGQRSLAVAAARQRARAIQAAGQRGTREAQLRALDTYLQILRLTGRMAVLRQRYAAVQAHRKAVEDLFEQGLVARNDLLETQVRERELDDAQQALEDDRQMAIADLNRLLGRPVKAPAVFPDSLGPPPGISVPLEAYLSQADTLNPGLRAARFQVEAARIQARLARRAYWPEVYVAAGHNYEENQYMAYPHINSVVAGVNWKIFEGGARKAKIQQAQARTARAVKTYEDGRRVVNLAVESAWRRWQQSLREELTARKNVAAAQANLEIVEDQYRSGLARSSDVLDAEALLAKSRFEVINRHYDSYWNQARLLTTAGIDPAGFYKATDGKEGG